MLKMNKTMIAMLILVTTVWSQTGPKLEISIADQKVNLTKEEKAGDTPNYSPGDTILYTITSTNVGDATMKEAVITDPIPAGVSYIAETATGADAKILYSINAGASYSEWPVTYNVRNSRGIIIKRKATGDMVSHIQWELEKNLAAGESHTAEFKVVVKP